MSEPQIQRRPAQPYLGIAGRITDGVPAFVVLHDTTLDELAARRPRSTGELAAVRGLGPTKLERYGTELLALLATA